MSWISLKWFAGMVPRRGEQHLPAPHATDAQNVNLYSGELRPLKKPALAHEFCRPEDECWNAPLDDPYRPPALPPCPVGGEPPVIIEQPQSENTYPGAQVTLTVVAEGTAPLLYQWFQSNIAIPGAVDASYTFTAVEQDVSIPYTVTVSGPCGELLSDPALINTELSSELCEIFGDSLLQLPDVVAVWPFDEDAPSNRSLDWTDNGFIMTGGAFAYQYNSPIADCRRALGMEGFNSGSQYQDRNGPAFAEDGRGPLTWGCFLSSQGRANSFSTNEMFCIEGHNLPIYVRIRIDVDTGIVLAVRYEAGDDGTSGPAYVMNSDPGLAPLENMPNDEWVHVMVVMGARGEQVKFYKNFELWSTANDNRLTECSLCPARQLQTSIFGRNDQGQFGFEYAGAMAWGFWALRALSSADILFMKSEYERQENVGDVGVSFYFAGPLDGVVNDGEVVVFDCLPTVGSPFTFQWYKNNEQLMAGEVNQTLTVTASSSTDGDTYYCRVTNSSAFQRKTRRAFMKVNFTLPATTKFYDYMRAGLDGQTQTGFRVSAYWPMNEGASYADVMNDVHLHTDQVTVGGNNCLSEDGSGITSANSDHGPMNEPDDFAYQIVGENSNYQNMSKSGYGSQLLNGQTMGTFIRRYNVDGNVGNNLHYNVLLSCFPLAPGPGPYLTSNTATRNNTIQFAVTFYNGADPADGLGGKLRFKADKWIQEFNTEEPPELAWKQDPAMGVEVDLPGTWDDEWHHIMVYFFSPGTPGNDTILRVWIDFEEVYNARNFQNGFGSGIPGENWRLNWFDDDFHDQYQGQWDGIAQHGFLLPREPTDQEVIDMKRIYEENAAGKPI